jgi:hypothetical protein
VAPILGGITTGTLVNRLNTCQFCFRLRTISGDRVGKCQNGSQIVQDVRRSIRARIGLLSILVMCKECSIRKLTRVSMEVTSVRSLFLGNTGQQFELLFWSDEISVGASGPVSAV